MPSLIVTIDPENRTGQDAQRVAGNLDRVGLAADTMGRRITNAEGSLTAASRGLEQVSVRGFVAATSLLDIVRATDRLSDGAVSLTDITFAATNAAQAVTLLSSAFGLSTLASVGVVAGVAASSYALLKASADDAAESQEQLNRTLADIEKTRVSYQAARLVGDNDRADAQFNRFQEGILGVIESMIELDRTWTTLSPEVAQILGLKPSENLGYAGPLSPGIPIFSRSQIIDAYKRFAPVEETVVDLSAYQDLLAGLELQIQVADKSRAAQEAAFAAFSIERRGGALEEGGVNRLEQLFDQLEQQDRLRRLSDDMSHALVDPIEQAILAGGEFEDVLANIGQALQAAFIRNVIAEPLAQSLSAQFFSLFGGIPLFGQHGLAISGGAVTGLAHGGLLTQPTYMGSGVVAREAGRDEFVMPAARVGQDLGVKAIADPATAAELGQQTALLRQLVALASGGGNSLGLSARQGGRRF